MHQRKIFALATIPDRIVELEQTIESVYEQADIIYVFLNGHKEVPHFLDREKIRFRQGDNSLGDAAKFFWFDYEKGYYFTLDDDLIYPPDYSDKMIAYLDSLNRNAVVTLHGRKFHKMPLISYYRDKSKYTTLRCLSAVQGNHRIHVGGTGVMVCHTSTLALTIKHFERPNMADIWLSKQAAIQGVPIYCMEHEAGWVKYIESMENRYTIYDADRSRDRYQTEVVNDFSWPEF